MDSILGTHEDLVSLVVISKYIGVVTDVHGGPNIVLEVFMTSSFRDLN